MSDPRPTTATLPNNAFIYFRGVVWHRADNGWINPAGILVIAKWLDRQLANGRAKVWGGVS